MPRRLDVYDPWLFRIFGRGITTGEFGRRVSGTDMVERLGLVPRRPFVLRNHVVDDVVDDVVSAVPSGHRIPGVMSHLTVDLWRTKCNEVVK